MSSMEPDDRPQLLHCHTVAEAIRCVAIELVRGRQRPRVYWQHMNCLKVVQTPLFPASPFRLPEVKQATKQSRSGGNNPARRRGSRVTVKSFAHQQGTYLKAMGELILDGDLSPSLSGLPLPIGSGVRLKTKWISTCRVQSTSPVSLLYAALRCMATGVLSMVESRPGLAHRGKGPLARCAHTTGGRRCPKFFIKKWRTSKYCECHLTGTRQRKASRKRQQYPEKKRQWDGTRGRSTARQQLIVRLRPRLAKQDCKRLEAAALKYLHPSKSEPAKRARGRPPVEGVVASYSHFVKNFDRVLRKVPRTTPTD